MAQSSVRGPGRTREGTRPELQPQPWGWEGGFGFYTKEAVFQAIRLKKRGLTQMHSEPVSKHGWPIYEFPNCQEDRHLQ